ncbi:B-box type zinc finger protein ncl-1-like [Haliotis cracherodii]|uniref:B-box type zinc finger protein ncl-1-like n=1 Tax=Haliotis rufescens TaxID=6454 RepID=UPI001EB08E62|nr:B-box type zinc finger protein ncl-1-like [Haliotis rufescens]XP_046377274.1 B-box type zinc finger protein ncl-1-like [Haliotis rufescens]
MASEDGSPKVSPISSPLLTSSSLENEEQKCPICEEKLKKPKVLTCLHVFCEACLEKQIEEDKDEDEDDGKDSAVFVTPSCPSIICTQCKQETIIPSKGANGLPTEHILSDMLDMTDMGDMQLVCTSCKAKEKAVARCSDCASFLCPICVTAHQFMRCFENHKVVSFEELQNGGGLTIHKPIFCPVHTSENLKYYCNTCQVPICNDCMLSEHRQPEHSHEKISDIEEQQKEDLKSLVTESKSKVSICQEATSNLENALSELQIQRDNAKGLIQETFQSCKAVLEKRKDDLLKELEEMHSSQELGIMEMFHIVGSTVEKIEDACKFTERVLEHGNSVQMLLVKQLITSQLMSLINNTPKLDVSVDIKFNANTDVFKEAAKKTFGSFAKEEMKIDTQLSSLHSSFDNDAFSLPHGVLSPTSSMMATRSSISDFMPSLRCITPVSINGSVVDSLHNMVSVPPPIGRCISGVGHPSSQDSSLSRNSHSPAMSDSGISVDAASTGSSQSATMINIAAMAKLGSVGFNNQGQVTLNGQVISGMNINNPSTGSGGGNSNPSSRTQTPLSQPDTSLNILTSAPQRSPNSSNLDTLANLFSQSSQQMNGVSNALGNLSNLTNLANLDTMGLGNMGNLMNSPDDTDITTFDPSVAGGSSQFPPMRRVNKMSAMQIRCKFGQLGPGKGQFNSPHGFCLGIDEDIIVADTNNHRIQVFEKTGEFKYQFGIPGREEGQLWYPRKVAVMRTSGKYVVCDRGNERSRMQIFTKNGHFVKKIAIRYIDIVAGLAITQQGHIVAVDSVSPTVFCIGESGDLIKWFDCSDYMREPSDIAISGKEYFVCDFKGHCVVVFNEDGQFMRRIGCENITNYPNGIDISDAGDVLVGDSHGNRFHVAVFQRDGSLIGEFQCPYVKVSRCCGLKITSEGYIVTLAKNNHHVLVLNTLYIT